MSIKDWTENENDKAPDPSSFTQTEQELLKDATPRQLKAYGRLDPETIEFMIVGVLVGPPNVDKADCSAAEKLVEAAYNQTGLKANSSAICSAISCHITRRIDNF